MPFITRLFLLVVILLSQFSYANNRVAQPKLFLYASDLPTPLKTYQESLQLHSIDVLLATQKFNIVFSNIPEYLSKSNRDQYVLKYKIRTGSNLNYKISYYLYDINELIQVREQSFLSTKKNILRNFRLGLYEFILMKKLTAPEMRKFDQYSKDRIESIKKKYQTNLAPLPIQQPKDKELAPINTEQEVAIISIAEQNKEAHQSKSIWDLIRDKDRDISWSNPQNKATQKNHKKEKSRNFSLTPEVRNPFTKIGSKSKVSSDEEPDHLRTHIIHIAWKYINRSLDIKDLIQLRSKFESNIGLNLEWIFYDHYNFSKLFYRLQYEIDKTFNTSPIDLSSHYRIRPGVGYRLTESFILSSYYERSNLVFANLNNIGDTISESNYNLDFLVFESSYLTDSIFLTVQLSTPLHSSPSTKDSSTESIHGLRVGAMARYYFPSLFLGISPWIELEGYYDRYSQDITSSRTLKIDRKEVSFKLGTYF